MKYLAPTFQSPANSDEYRNNWDAVFGESQDERVKTGGPQRAGRVSRCIMMPVQRDGV